ncbi:MAG: ATP synthase F1 subunit delta [Planctomycetota bacterium]
MIRRSPVSGTYARALLEVGQARAEADTYLRELDLLRKQIVGAPEVRVFFESPKIPRAEKKRVLERGLGGRITEPVLNLLRILIDRGRQAILGEIVESYEDLYDEMSGRVHVRLASATPLSEAARARIVALLGEQLDRQIIAEEQVVGDLLGGMTIRVGDTVIDGSLRSKLNKVREAIAAPRLGSGLFDED